MIVAAQGQLDVPGCQQINDLAVIAHVFGQRVMVHIDNRHSCRDGPEHTVKPDKAFPWYKCRGHAHVGPRVGANVCNMVVDKIKLLVAKGLQECVASAFRPFGIMVSGQYVPWFFQRVQQSPGQFNFQVGPKFGDIPGNDHKINAVPGVDVPDYSQ